MLKQNLDFFAVAVIVLVLGVMPLTPLPPQVREKVLIYRQEQLDAHTRPARDDDDGSDVGH